MGFSEFLAKKPVLSYCGCCGLLNFTLLLFVGLALFLQEEFFEYNLAVPLYLRGDKYMTRWDAIKFTRNHAATKVVTPIVELERSNAAIQGLEISLMFESVDSASILQMPKLEAIVEIESTLFSTPTFQSICLLSWNATMLESMRNNDVEGVSKANKGLLPTCAPQMSIFGMFSSEDLTSQDAVHARVEQLWNSSSLSLKALVDDKFGKESSSQEDIMALRTVFKLGLPLKGNNNTEDTDEMLKHLESKLFEEMLPILEKLQNSKSLKSRGVRMWFAGFGLVNAFIQRQIAADMSWAFFSFLFVFIFTAAMKRSFFIASQGLFILVAGLAPAYLFYRLILMQRYFGVFNLLTVFLIAGIGADSIYVLSDTFEHSTRESLQSMTERMRWTLNRAGKAILVTSLTTAISFLATAASEFPGISTFGYFAFSLIAVNFLLIIGFFPAVLMMRQFHFRGWCCCDPCCGSGKRKEAKVRPSDGNSVKETPEKRGKMQIYFDEVHGQLIDRYRKKIITLFMILFGLTSWLAAQIEPDPEPPQFFPKQHNLNQFSAVSLQFFASTSDFRISIAVAHGFLNDMPMDRSGTEPSFANDIGVAVYDNNFSFQKVAACERALCLKFLQINNTLGLDGSNEITCWPQELFDIEFGNAENWNAALGNSSLFNFHLENFLASASNQKRNVVFEEETNIERMSLVEVKTTKLNTMTHDDGLEFLRVWDQALHEWHKEFSSCRETGLPFLLSSRAGVQFQVGKQLMSEAFRGIALSLILAYVVLTVFSGNFQVAFLAIICISAVVLSVMAYVSATGKLGLLESIVLVMTPGLSVDFTAHLAEAFIAAGTKMNGRKERMIGALSHLGISLFSGAISTLGACFFLFFPLITFFVQFGTFVFLTIAFSLLYSMVFFTALMFELGPQGDTGDIMKTFRPK